MSFSPQITQITQKGNEVSTTCGSGWIKHSSRVGHALGPPATARGTDLIICVVCG